MIVYLMNCMFQYLPRLLSIFRIHNDPVFKSLYLEIPLLLRTHGFKRSDPRKPLILNWMMKHFRRNPRFWKDKRINFQRWRKRNRGWWEQRLEKREMDYREMRNWKRERTWKCLCGGFKKAAWWNFESNNSKRKKGRIEQKIGYF